MPIRNGHTHQQDGGFVRDKVTLRPQPREAERSDFFHEDLSRHAASYAHQAWMREGSNYARRTEHSACDKLSHSLCVSSWVTDAIW